jgi:DNA polymerase III epsilon subunit-like protein
MENTLISFGKYKHQLTYKEVVQYYPGYCLSLLFESHHLSKDVYQFFSDYSFFTHHHISTMEDLESFFITKIIYAELPEDWVDHDSMTEMLKMCTKSSTIDINHVMVLTSTSPSGSIYTLPSSPNNTPYNAPAWNHSWPFMTLPNISSYGLKYGTPSSTAPYKYTWSISRRWADLVWKQIILNPHVIYATLRTEKASLITNMSWTLPLTLYTSYPLSLDLFIPKVDIFLDTETTSLPKKMCSNIPSDINKFPIDAYSTCRLLEIAWIVRDCRTHEIYETVNIIVQPPTSFTSKPYDPSLFAYAKKHGNPITNVAYQLCRLLDCYPNSTLVCHNVVFDRAVIASELAYDQRHYLYSRWVQLPTLCTMLKASPQFGRWPKLQVLYDYFKHPPMIQTHRALDDVNMLICCFDSMKQQKWI